MKAILCPLTQNNVQITLTPNNKPTDCDHADCKHKDQLRCLLHAKKITIPK